MSKTSGKNTKASVNIQDGFLFQSLRSGETLTVALLTGSTLEGVLKRFDRFALVLECGGRDILVYKHAVATVERKEQRDGT